MAHHSEPFVVAQYEDKEETRLENQVVCRLIHIENISESREKALEEWRYYHNPNTALFERMEHVNRPVIYGIDLDATENDQKARTSKATHKLLLADTADNYFYAIEMEELTFLNPTNSPTDNPLPIQLGGQLVVKKGALVLFGIILLRNMDVSYSAPDPSSNAVHLLNSGIVEKYIDILGTSLRELDPNS